MIKAIVYTSKAGHTKKYAELLSQEIGIPYYTLDEGKKLLAKNDEIVYMGWLMAGFVKGLKKAKCYNLKAVCGVGSTPPSEKEHTRIGNQNKVPLDKFFLLLGGYDINNLSGLYGKMMQSVSKGIIKNLSSKPESELTEDEKLTLLIMQGKDYVSVENLAPVIELLKN